MNYKRPVLESTSCCEQDHTRGPDVFKKIHLLALEFLLLAPDKVRPLNTAPWSRIV